MIRAKTAYVASRKTITLDGGAKREVLTLECGHTVTQALRPKRRNRVVCVECAESSE